MDTIKTDTVVLGAGPGGYAAAFYAADHGGRVLLVDPEPRLGGVCLNRGCIPSKALLHAISVIPAARHSAARGISFGEPTISLEKLQAWKNTILEKLQQGIRSVAERRGVEILQGTGRFESSSALAVDSPGGPRRVEFKNAIIAVGTKPALPPVFDIRDPRIMTSTEALELTEIPGDLLIVGGGYIGVELGMVFAALGSRVVTVEILGTILAGADSDLVRHVAKAVENTFRQVRVNTRVTGVKPHGAKVQVTMESNGEVCEESFDRVLVSVGRTPNADGLGLENTRVKRNEKGFIEVDQSQRTADPAIHAVGDISGGLLLAHKAVKDARIAVESIAGKPGRAGNIVIPAVVFTDPEIAWCGLTETEARQKGVAVEISRFPWGASGRALTHDRTDGVTKLILDPKTEKILGVGIVGHGAGELISEAVLALRLGATARDLAETVHPHPTLSETLMESAELFYGHSLHAYVRKRA